MILKVLVTNWSLFENVCIRNSLEVQLEKPNSIVHVYKVYALEL